jgi:CRISPR-associated protein Cmr4
MIASGISELPPTPKPGDGEALLPGSKLYAEGKAFLEDLDFEAKPDDTTANWAECLAGSIFPKEADATWKQIFKERFAVISDNCFNFLSKTGTEVAAHIKIDDDKKIVAKHALWYEEALPAEAILAGVAWCDRVYKSKDIKDIDETKIFRTFCPAAGLDLQIGGRATVGKGRVRCLFTGS